LTKTLFQKQDKILEVQYNYLDIKSDTLHNATKPKIAIASFS